LTFSDFFKDFFQKKHDKARDAFIYNKTGDVWFDRSPCSNPDDNPAITIFTQHTNHEKQTTPMHFLNFFHQDPFPKLPLAPRPLSKFIVY